MSVRDRYDAGGRAAVTRQERMARIVQEQTMAACAHRTITRALHSPARLQLGTLEEALVGAYYAERFDRGMDS